MVIEGAPNATDQVLVPTAREEAAEIVPGPVHTAAKCKSPENNHCAAPGYFAWNCQKKRESGTRAATTAAIVARANEATSRVSGRAAFYATVAVVVR